LQAVSGQRGLVRVRSTTKTVTLSPASSRKGSSVPYDEYPSRRAVRPPKVAGGPPLTSRGD